MKVALVHDCLRTYGDAERVLAVIHQIYPQAPVFTAFIDRHRLGDDWQHFADWHICTSWAQRLPAIARYYWGYRGLCPYFWEALDLSGFDLVLSSSGGYLSHSVLTRADALHLCYCHTPSRSLWEPATYAPRLSRSSNWIDTNLRQYDFYAMQRVDQLFTNSETVARRIQKYYRRTATVVVPPVKVAATGKAGERHYLYAGELAPQQQVDLVVQACRELEQPLVIVGLGNAQAPDYQAYQSYLRQLGGTVQFIDNPSKAEMAQIYANTRALIFPRTDADFGFTPVEAMGYGVPVIASAQSGIREVVLNYRTGLLFAEATVAGLCQTLTQFEGLRFFSHACIQRAEEFAEATFIDRFKWLVAQAIDANQQGKETTST